MREIDFMFTSTDTQIHLFNVKVYYLRFEVATRHFSGLELSPKRKPKI